MEAFRRSKLDTVAGSARRIFFFQGGCSGTVRNTEQNEGLAFSLTHSLTPTHSLPLTHLAFNFTVMIFSKHEAAYVCTTGELEER